MVDHKICFYGEIWLFVPVTPSYLELCFVKSFWAMKVVKFEAVGKQCRP